MGDVVTTALLSSFPTWLLNRWYKRRLAMVVDKDCTHSGHDNWIVQAWVERMPRKCSILTGSASCDRATGEEQCSI